MTMILTLLNVVILKAVKLFKLYWMLIVTWN